MDFEIVINLYKAEKLPAPAILTWPLNESAENDRQSRESKMNSIIKKGLPSGLAWMKNHQEQKYRPDLVLKDCKTILVSWINYYRQDEIDLVNNQPDTIGKVARYARGRDYHKVLGYRLKRIAKSMKTTFPGTRTMNFTDAGPLDEVWLAEASGLAFRGRHGLAIIPRVGSWVCLGCILSTDSISKNSAKQFKINQVFSCPSDCRRCLDACPTKALEWPGKMNHNRCISYQNIEHKGAVPPEFHDAWQDKLFGCDACQEACPFNFKVAETTESDFITDYAGASLPLNEIKNIKNDEQFKQKFAGSALMRRGLKGMQQNAEIISKNKKI